MHAENVVELQRSRNFAKKLCGIISETFAGPVDGLMGIVVKFVWIEAVSNDRVVVPKDDVFRSAGDFLKDLLGTGPVSNDVTQADDGVDIVLLDIQQDSLQRLKVGVDIGDDSDSHGVLDNGLKGERQSSSGGLTILFF